MKYILALFIFIHGLIHLMGFVKAFDLAPVDQLKTFISRGSGIVWLITFLLFLLSATTLLANRGWWNYIAVSAVAVSTILIIASWSDARFGTIANIIILIAAVVSISSASFTKMVEEEKSWIIKSAASGETAVITEADIESLPYPVARWLKVSGVAGSEKVNIAWMSQNVKMKMKPGQEKWSDATSEQLFGIADPSFVWTVRMKMLPFIELYGRDKFTGGKGEMLIKILSLIKVVDEKGVKMDEGSMQRYLAEMVWIPSAALSNYIRWEAIDSLSSKAIMTCGDIAVSGTFFFNEQGEFVKFSTMRYKGNDADAGRYEWVVNVQEHARFNGIKIPSKMEVSWMLDEGEWTWLQMEITKILYNQVKTEK